MARSTLFYTHTSSKRDGAWWLEQDDDHTLHVRYENDMDRGDDWRKPLNEFLSGNGMASHRALMELVDRLFVEHGG